MYTPLGYKNENVMRGFSFDGTYQNVLGEKNRFEFEKSLISNACNLRAAESE